MSETFKEDWDNIIRNKIHRLWEGMMSKCWAEKNLCDMETGVYVPWREFDGFYDWVVENGYEDMLAIERINRSGNFVPRNCLFPSILQSRYKDDVLVEFAGKKMPLSEAAVNSGIHFVILRDRFREGDRGERLFRP